MRNAYIKAVEKDVNERKTLFGSVKNQSDIKEYDDVQEGIVDAIRLLSRLYDKLN